MTLSREGSLLTTESPHPHSRGRGGSFISHFNFTWCYISTVYIQIRRMINWKCTGVVPFPKTTPHLFFLLLCLFEGITVNDVLQFSSCVCVVLPKVLVLCSYSFVVSIVEFWCIAFWGVSHIFTNNCPSFSEVFPCGCQFSLTPVTVISAYRILIVYFCVI